MPCAGGAKGGLRGRPPLDVPPPEEGEEAILDAPSPSSGLHPLSQRDAVRIACFLVQLLSYTNRHHGSDRSVRSENEVFLPHSLLAMSSGRVSNRSWMQFVRVWSSSLLQQVPPTKPTLSRLVTVQYRINVDFLSVTGQVFLSYGVPDHALQGNAPTADIAGKR
jgi:hypothetical protein